MFLVMAFNLILASDPSPPQSEAPGAAPPKKQSCLVTIGKLATAPVWFPFSSKRRFAWTAGSLVSLGAFVLPWVPTEEGLMSPAFRAQHNLRDWSLSGGNNSAQMEALEDPSVFIDSKKSATSFPQGVMLKPQGEQP